MYNNIESIKKLERELLKYNTAKREGESLEKIRTNINARIKVLLNLQEEMEDVSRELHYYDMVDYVGNVVGGALSLQQCTTLLYDLKGAQNKFKEDGDESYQKKCIKLIQKVEKVGKSKCKEMVAAEQESYREVQDFLRQNGDMRAEIEDVYFAARRRKQKSNLAEYARDLKKHYQMMIVGELVAYKEVFDEDIQTKHRSSDVRDSLNALGKFGEHIKTILASIFKRVKRDAVLSLITQDPQLEGEVLTPDAIFTAGARGYYGSEFGNKIVVPL